MDSELMHKPLCLIQRACHLGDCQSSTDILVLGEHRSLIDNEAP